MYNIGLSIVTVTIIPKDFDPDVDIPMTRTVVYESEQQALKYIKNFLKDNCSIYTIDDYDFYVDNRENDTIHTEDDDGNAVFCLITQLVI